MTSNHVHFLRLRLLWEVDAEGLALAFEVDVEGLAWAFEVDAGISSDFLVAGFFFV